MPTPDICPRCRQRTPGLTPDGVCPACAGAPGGRTVTADPDAATPFAATGSAVTAVAAVAARAAFPDPPPGYELLDRIGAGGMGLVFQARERATGRLVAVKYIHAVSHPSARERFRVEVQALARVRHPNVVQVFHVELDGREPYFTMEHLPGGTLARLLADGPPPFAAAARLVQALARGVQAAHAAGVLHRDLKPSNVLSDADGVPKVVDFGLAKWVDRDDGLTNPGSLVGTPSYMAPEQAARRTAEIGPASDVYSLGAILYECLTGRPPFKGADPMATVLLVVSQQPAAPRAVRPDVPPDLEAVCLKCLEKDPAARYPTAAALADDLGRFLRSESTVARPMRWPRRAWRRAKRNWRWAAAAAVLAAAVGVGAAIRPRGAGPAPDPAAEISDAVAAGRAVTLIPASGPPRYAAWRLNAAALAPSPEGDGACSFAVTNHALLELAPDPGAERYRFSAELRQVRAVPVGQAAALPGGGAYDGDFAGLYFGYARPDRAGGGVHTLFGVTFNDYVGPPVKQVRNIKAAVRVRAAFLPDQTDPPADPGIDGIASYKFDPAPGRPGGWRWVGIEVAPDRVRVLWRAAPPPADGPAPPPVVVLDASADDVRGRYAGLSDKLTLWRPDYGVAVPPWQPRMPLGLWARSGAVAFRNVLLEPLPQP